MSLKGTTLLSIPHDRKEKVRGNKTKVRAGRGPGEGERWERCQRQVKRPERVAAVGERRSRAVGKESTGHRNRRRDISLAGAINSTPPRAASLGTFCADTESTAPGRDRQ